MGYLYDSKVNHFVRTDNVKEGLPQIMWHITYECSLQCKFCFSKKESAQLDITKLENYLEHFVKLAVQKIDISGGEPLHYPFLKQICNGLIKNGIFMTLTTRGIGMAENIQWVIDNRNMFARIIVSVDVPDPILQQDLTGDYKSYENTQKFIQELSGKQHKNTRINTVVTRYLLEDKILERMLELIRESGCREWCLIEPHPANKKETFEQVTVNKKEFESIVEKVKRAWRINNCKVLVRYAENYSNYWILYPEGLLAKHTDCEVDTMEMDFLNTPCEFIMKNVKKSNLWVPGGN